ncbi:M20/M25/M40 family metallo-hydrolase [Silvibacterium sp.]|uniref:M20/M25/M40 family metallo-hydrolase n=1 Tax=Silvibacterium sp. TaxID=1964179 RepID=UPI0039E34D06
MKHLVSIALVLATAPSLLAQEPARPIVFPAVPGPITAKYKPDADRILAAALQDTDGYNDLEYLCDHIGNRNSGTPQLNTAITWAADLMRKAGLENAQIQPVDVPHWVRGDESAEFVAPIKKKIHLLGLGMSDGTPPEGLTAQVVFVHTFEELDALPDSAVKGKIVVFNPGWHGYGVNSGYRTGGPSRAAAKGAIAALIRSATPLAQQLPHTGTLRYAPDAPKIPAAAISIEDAELIERLAHQGPVTVHLKMDAQQLPDVQAGNVIGEIPGSEHPEQVVVLGGHIDSWDVGQGAQDDGTGIMATFEAVSLLHKLGLHPKRTIRLVFWVNEENGGAGGRAYAKLVGDKVGNHVAAIEMDNGAERPLGVAYGSFGPPRTPGDDRPGTPRVNPGAAFDIKRLSPEEKKSVDTLLDLVDLLKPIDAAGWSPGGGGSDIGPIVAEGVPSLSPRTVGEHYFDWHHTEADTFDKVDLEDFRRNIGLLAVTTYVLADIDGRLTGRKGTARE